MQAQHLGPQAIFFNHLGMAGKGVEGRIGQAVNRSVTQGLEAQADVQRGDQRQWDPQQIPVFLGARDDPAAFGQAGANAVHQPGGGENEQWLHAVTPAAVQAPGLHEQPGQQAEQTDVEQYPEEKIMGLAQGGVGILWQRQRQVRVIAMTDPRALRDQVQRHLPQIKAQRAAATDEHVPEQGSHHHAAHGQHTDQGQ